MNSKYGSCHITRGVDRILGTEFMIPAGVRLDLFNLTAKLPDELVVPLLKSAKEVDGQDWGGEVTGGPRDTMSIDQRGSEVFKLQRNNQLDPHTSCGFVDYLHYYPKSYTTGKEKRQQSG